MTPLRFVIIVLFFLSVLKIIFFYRYVKTFKPRALTKEELKAFDEEDDRTFFEDDEF